MTTLTLHPTALAQWQALVNEAENTCKTPLGEDLQSYLVFLLMRYMTASEFANSLLAIEYLTSLNQQGRLREIQLRDVGDKCLLYSGLFPNHAERRRVKISYYVDLGISAYSSLALSLQGIRAQIFNQLSYQFVLLMDVLQAVRTLNHEEMVLQPLQALELWQDTGSHYARAQLSRYTQAIPIPLDNLERNLQ